ncbi:MAG: CarD family transcriptional regulator [Lachnospiraceae bacterium]|nr:CarD family transcriptional regulator [Lachnospiraceae bacterium]
MIAAARSYIERDSRTFIPPEGDLFAKGDRIVHRAFGPGVIEDIDADDKCYIIQFDRLDTQRRIAFRVKMERESV